MTRQLAAAALAAALATTPGATAAPQFPLRTLLTECVIFDDGTALCFDGEAVLNADHTVRTRDGRQGDWQVAGNDFAMRLKGDLDGDGLVDYWRTYRGAPSNDPTLPDCVYGDLRDLLVDRAGTFWLCTQ